MLQYFIHTCYSQSATSGASPAVDHPATNYNIVLAERCILIIPALRRLSPEGEAVKASQAPQHQAVRLAWESTALLLNTYRCFLLPSITTYLHIIYIVLSSVSHRRVGPGSYRGMCKAFCKYHAMLLERLKHPQSLMSERTWSPSPRVSQFHNFNIHHRGMGPGSILTLQFSNSRKQLSFPGLCF